jgi:hypothetical protein
MSDNTISIDLSNTEALGENIKAVKNGSQVILIIDASKRLGPSASGKSMIIATTRGNMSYNGLSFGVNVYSKIR